MGASRFRKNGNERKAAAACQRSVRRFGGRAVGMRFPQNNAPLFSSDGKGHAALVGGFPVNQRKIAFFDFSAFHGKGEAVCGNRVTSNENGTARFSVKSRDGAKDKGNVAVEIGKRVR